MYYLMLWKLGYRYCQFIQKIYKLNIVDVMWASEERGADAKTTDIKSTTSNHNSNHSNNNNNKAKPNPNKKTAE